MQMRSSERPSNQHALNLERHAIQMNETALRRDDLLDEISFDTWTSAGAKKLIAQSRKDEWRFLLLPVRPSGTDLRVSHLIVFPSLVR
jgi:hypothetical protein